MRTHSAILIALVLGIGGAILGCGSTAVLPDHDPTQGGGFVSQVKWTPIQPADGHYHVRRPVEPPESYRWYPDILEPNQIVKEELYLTGANGNQLYINVHRPVWSSAEKPCHGLVLVPGGKMKGEVWQVPWRRSSSQHWAAAGFVVVDFDFQGRGRSEGEEDYYGPVHQQDLRTVILYCANRPDVLPCGVGLVSSSWGVTVCAGTLATYPLLPVKFYIDLEGAHDRVTSTQNNDPFWVNIWGGHDMSDDEFWDVREAITYQPRIRAPYFRIQSDMDHAFDRFFVRHAIEMVNAAVLGECPYARMNHNPPNQTLDLLRAEQYQYEDIDLLDEVLYMQVAECSMMEF